jgi:hypothetical protein
MIEWLITTTKEATTAYTSASESYSVSASLTTVYREGASPDSPFGGPITESATRSTSSSSFTFFSFGIDGYTARSSYQDAGADYFEYLPDLTSDTSFAQGLIEAGINTLITFSNSSSGETTSDYGTWSIETSTTDTQEYGVEQITSSQATTETIVLSETTSFLEDKSTTASTVVVSSRETTQSEWFLSFALSTRTVDTTTTVGTETLAGNATFATVVQAETKTPEAEIIYRLTNRPTHWSGLSAATDQAESGTRLTLAPSFSTEQLQVTGTSQATFTSTISKSAETYSITYQTTVSVGSTRTIVLNRFVLPNPTTTQTFISVSTASSSISSEIFPDEEVTYGFYSALFVGLQFNTTRPKTIWGHSLDKQSRYHHTVAFDLLSSVPQSTVVSVTWPFVLTQEYSTNSSATSSEFFSATESYQTGEDESDGKTETVVFSQSAAGGTTQQGQVTIEKNSYLDLPSAAIVTNGGAATARSRWVQAGAVVGSKTGLFVSAPNTVNLLETARHGGSVYFSQYPPYTGDYETVDGSSITYYTTTATTGAISSISTTSSMTFDVSGEPNIVIPQNFSDATETRIRPFGGGAFGGTVIDRASPGVYKNLNNGSTTSFAGEDTSYAMSDFVPLSKFQPIRMVTGMGNGGTPAYWTEKRNSTALP